MAQLEAENPGYFPALPILPDLPAAGTAFVNNVIPRNGDQWHFRIDHNLNSDRDRIYLSNYNTIGTDAIDDPRPKNWLTTSEVSWLPKLNWVHTISPSLLNEASDNLSENHRGFYPITAESARQLMSQGISTLGTWGGLPWAENDFDLHDTISWMHGSHNMRIRHTTWITRPTSTTLPPDDARPFFHFANLLDFAQDLPSAQSGPAVYTPTRGTSTII